jgi:hypothetical protein
MPTVTNKLREILERFELLPDEAVVPSKVTAIILGTSERTVRCKLCREGIPQGVA